MPAGQHNNVKLCDKVWDQLDKGVKFYKELGLVTLPGYFNCRFLPNTSIRDRVGMYAQTVKLNADSSPYHREAKRMLQFLIENNLYTLNDRLHGPNPTFFSAAQKCPKTTLDYTGVLEGDFDGLFALEIAYNSKNALDVDYILLYADFESIFLRKKCKRPLQYKYHGEPPISQESDFK